MTMLTAAIWETLDIQAEEVNEGKLISTNEE